MFMWDKIDFKAKTLKRDKEDHSINNKGSFKRKRNNNYKHIFIQCWHTQS
jgi:hypothetical protein